MVRDGEDRQGTLTDDPTWEVVGDVVSENGGALTWVPSVPVSPALTAAANTDKYDGGMIALVPANPADLALPGMEPVEDLHLTMWFLADSTADITDEASAAWQEICADVAAKVQSISTAAFGVGIWNPNGDTPAIVLNIADPDRQLTSLRSAISERSDNAIGVPEWTDIVDMQHKPWVPHVCLAYESDADLLMVAAGAALAKVGPITFDTLRLAIGGTNYDYRLEGPTDA